MNCAVHVDTPAVAYCRTCGRALCDVCKRDVKGVIYCEDCLAAQVAHTMPAVPPVPAAYRRAPSPGLAAFLGFIPGVGAMYNGQFVKGFIHVGIFAALVAMAEEFHAFGIFIFAFIVYMVVDAYQTAKAMEVGAPLPDLLGINRLAANVAGTSATAVPPAGVAPVSGATGAPPISQGAPVAAEPAGSNAPLGAIILILIGALFLLDNMGIFHMRWVGRMWPLILIVIGLWMLFRRRGYPQQG